MVSHVFQENEDVINVTQNHPNIHGRHHSSYVERQQAHW
jgi:hypothetical protein